MYTLPETRVIARDPMSELDSIVKQFSKNLPGIERAHDFAQGMVLYYASYKEYRDNTMNCEPVHPESSSTPRTP
jgi:hypothetical protein